MSKEPHGMLPKEDHVLTEKERRAQAQSQATPTPQGTAPPQGQGSVASINEPQGSTVGSTIEDHPPQRPAEVLPVISALSQDNAVIGDPSFTLYITGTGFTDASVIVFADNDEPTTLEQDGTVSTGVNMDVWQGPDTVSVAVRNGAVKSNELDFTFEEAAADPEARKSTPKRKR